MIQRSDSPQRHSLRLKGYDYSHPGAYFVTICIHNREFLLGDEFEGRVRINDAGCVIQQTWSSLPSMFPGLALDVDVVMPNHIHGILVIEERLAKHKGAGVRWAQGHLGDHKDRPYSRPRGTLPGTIGRIVQAFKSATTGNYVAGVRKYGWKPFKGRLWQRNYFEHVIRNEKSLNRIREYICANPLRWPHDLENPAATALATDELDEILRACDELDK